MLAASDVGGSEYYLAHELRRRDLVDIRLAVLDVHRGATFPADVSEILDGGAELWALIDQADVLHFVDLVPDQISILGRSLGARLEARGRTRTVVQFDGGLSVARQRLATQLARERGWALVSTRPGLAARWGAHFVPPFVPWWHAAWRPLVAGTRKRESLRRPGIVFVSSLAAVHRNRVLENMLDRVEAHTGESLRLEVMTRMPHRNILRRRRFSHLCLTASADGLGRSALESLCQGVSVIADLDRNLARCYAALADGELPPVSASSCLEERIEAIDPRGPTDPSLRKWATRVLAPQRWFELCQALWRGESRAA